MPFYDYECLACGKALKAFQRKSDGPLLSCPFCSGQMNKLDGYDGEGAIDLRPSDISWCPAETDIHRGWKKRRKWKRDAMAAYKRQERVRERDGKQG